MSVESKPTNEPAVLRRSQFSLRTLLLLPVFLAAICSVLFATPPVVSVVEVVAFSLILPPALTTVVIYGRGYKRTFCIGALFPAGMLFLIASYVGLAMCAGGNFDMSDIAPMRGYLIAGLSAVAACGLISVAIRWGLEAGRGWQRLLFWGAVTGLLFVGPLVGQVGLRVGWWAEPDPVSGPVFPATTPPPDADVAPAPSEGGRPPAPEASAAPTWDPYGTPTGSKGTTGKDRPDPPEARLAK